MASDTDGDTNEVILVNEDDSYGSGSQESSSLSEAAAASNEDTISPNPGTSNRSQNSSPRNITFDLATSSGQSSFTTTRVLAPISRFASTSSDGVSTTSGQDVTTSSSQEPSCSSLLTVRSGPSSVCPVGGSVATDTAHVTQQASGDETLELVGAFVKGGEKSGYDCTVERRGGGHIHVHLTKTDIHQPKAVTVGGDVCVRPAPQKGTENPGPTSHLKRLRDKTEKTFNKLTEGMVMTKSTRTILNKIAQGRTWVTVTGCPGEGKSIAGYLVLKHLHNRGREVFDVKTREDYFTAKGVGQSVILLNDIFGELIFDSDSFKRWQSVLSDVLALSEHKQGFIDKINRSQKQNKPDVTVIFICKSSILREASRKMGKFKHLMLKEDNMVDLTEMIELDATERMKIWKCHAEQYSVSIESRIVREVCSMKLSHGFPHCCRLFAAMYKKNKLLNMKHFFLKPLKFLNQSMEAIMEDSLTGPMLRQMLKNDGSLDLEEIEDHEKRYQYSSVAKTMIGTYLVFNERKIEFHHSSIYDSAAFLICQMDPQFVISFCSLSFLNERVRLKGLTQSTVTQTHQTISVENGFEKILLERFLKEFQAYDISGVLSHESFHDESFVSKFMQTLLSSNSLTLSSRNIHDIFNVHDKQSIKSFLFLMTKSGSDKILRYIHEYVELTEEEQSEVLFGVCEHSSVSSLEYLLERYKNINLEVTNSDNQTPLLVSTKHSSHDMIRILLTRNVNVNALDNHGRTPLLNICKNGVNGDGVIVKMLLEKGAKVESQSPLCLACIAGHLNIVKALLNIGADVNKTDDIGLTPLLRACSSGNADVVVVLLERGADINKTDVNGLTSLHRACSLGHADVVTVLLGKDADFKIRDNDGWTSLHYACYSGHTDVVIHLLDRGDDVNTTNNDLTPFHTACFKGHVDVVTVLLENGAVFNNTDSTGWTPLHTACLYGYFDVVMVLLAKGAYINKINDNGSTPIHKASFNGHVDVVVSLLKNGADINKTEDNGYTPFHSACFSRHVHVMTVLLDKGADIHKSDRCDRTPLHTACSKGYDDVVEVLLDMGAVINKRDVKGWTPLDAACFFGHANIVKVLLDRGADISKTIFNGLSTLHEACGLGHVDVVTLLTDKADDINTTDFYGGTPLHKACSTGQVDVVKVLLDKGADVNKTNFIGYTPLDSARLLGHVDVVTVLLDKCSDNN